MAMRACASISAAAANLTGCCATNSLQEQDDALEVIAWLARQTWCSGAVGMMGISWGGFNGLQVAARRPPALKAIVTMCSTDDRYRDDVHYMGGALLTAKFGWASSSSLDGSRPIPRWWAIAGGRCGWSGWRICRCSLNWLRHQRRDDYWKHGRCARITPHRMCGLAVGGWTDGYTNAIPRLLSGLGSAQGLIGPWAHRYPHFACPGRRSGSCKRRCAGGTTG